MKLVNCLTILAVTRLSFCNATTNWEKLKSRIKESDWNVAAETIVKQWSERPTNFFDDIDWESWQRILPPLVSSFNGILEIQNEELERSLTACRAFAYYLPQFSKVEALPRMFRFAVYEILMENNNANWEEFLELYLDSWIEKDGPQRITSLKLEDNKPTGVVKAIATVTTNDSPITQFYRLPASLNANDYSSQIFKIINSIPHVWIKMDGPFAMLALTSTYPERLGYLSEPAILTLLQNPKKACSMITMEMLMTLPNPTLLSSMSPTCMAAIKGLGSTDFTKILSYFPDNIFEEYDGALYGETIERISGNQLKYFGLKIDKAMTICTLLELRYLTAQAIGSITSRCLHGYFSQKRAFGLENLWEYIPLATLLQFSEEMKLSWANIHPIDFNFLPTQTRRLVFTSTHACSNLIGSSISEDLAKDFSGKCLYVILSSRRKNNPFELGPIWSYIQYQTIEEFLKETPTAVSTISGRDFGYMPWWMLHMIFKSDLALNNLPQPVCNILLPSKPIRFFLKPERFAAVAKTAPSLAGQLLFKSLLIPNNTFSHFDAATLRSLVYFVPGEGRLDWISIFNRLKKVQGFYFIVEQISKKVKVHFCASIESLNEYLTLTWLHSNMNEACRSAITFDLCDTLVMLRAPELVVGRLPWKEMLERYNLEDWSFISARKDLTEELGGICAFWAEVDKNHQAIMEKFHPDAVKRIKPRCVRELYKFLKSNSKFIPLLADDAFSKHQVGELPVSLKNLSVKQLGQLSLPGFFGFKSPSACEISTHVLASTTLEEIKSLDFLQFQTLLRLHWVFVPEKIKSEALKWHFSCSITLLKAFINYEVGGGIDRKGNQLDQNLASIIKNQGGLEDLLNALSLYITIKQSGILLDDTLNFAKLVVAISQSCLRDRFTRIIRDSDLPRALLVTLVRDSEELRSVLQDDIMKNNQRVETINLSFNRKTGFDRAATFAFLKCFPHIFALPRSNLYIDNVVDAGGPMRMLVSQILSDIERDLIVVGGGEGERKGKAKRLSNRTGKFVWGISGQVGFLVGIAFGKALQLGMRLSFILDPNFFILLIDQSDQTIERYFDKTYGEEMTIFKNKIRAIYNSNNSFWGGESSSTYSDPLLLNILTRPENLRFTSLSVEANVEKAKHDFNTKTNINGCGLGEGFQRLDQVVVNGSLNLYFEDLRQRVLEEFKLFIHELVKGLSYPLTLLNDFGTLTTVTLGPFAKFLPSLLNAEPIRADDIIKRITFTGNQRIKSLLGGHKIFASELFNAFITSLDERELRKLLEVWIGTSTLSLSYINLRVEFAPPLIEPVKLDFCHSDWPESQSQTFVIAPGEQYKKLFKKVAGSLHGRNHHIKPKCKTEGVYMYPTQVVVCLMRLSIPLQSAQKMVNSLVDVINTPLASIY